MTKLILAALTIVIGVGIQNSLGSNTTEQREDDKGKDFCKIPDLDDIDSGDFVRKLFRLSYEPRNTLFY